MAGLLDTAGDLQRAGDLFAPHLLFGATDLEEARAHVGRVFKPHALSVRGARQNLDARMHHLRVGNISLNRLCYGADVVIEPDRLESFFLVQMPLRGSAEIRCGRQAITSTPDLASTISPTEPLDMRWSGDCDQLIVRIEREALERACADHLGHPLDRPLVFDLGMRTGASDASPWHHLVAFLGSDLEFTRGASQSPLLCAQLEQLVIGALLTFQPHNYRDALLRPAATPVPYYVKRAEDYLLAHADQPLTILDLARHAGVSTRTIYAGFRHYRGMSPMAYLKDVRLDRLRRELLQAATGRISLTQIALKWGFAHQGHFAAAYRRKFGEAPSETLRRR